MFAICMLVPLDDGDEDASMIGDGDSGAERSMNMTFSCNFHYILPDLEYCSSD